MHPNEALVRAGYDAFVRGDITAVADMLDPDILWHVGGSSRLAGIYKGHAELMELLGRIGEITEGSMSIAARDVLAGDDHVIVLTTMKGRRGGRVLDDDGVAVFKISHGRATEVWVFAEDQASVDEFFGD